MRSKTARRLSYQEVAEILEDPAHVLVVEALSGDYYTATYDHARRLLEQVTLNADIATWLNDCVERKVLYYSRFKPTEDHIGLPAPYFYDVWWDSYMEKQPFEAKKEAFKMRAFKFNKGILF